MKESFSIRFYLNPGKTRDKKLQIYTRIIVEREKVELATKLFVDPKLWSEEAGRTSKASAINDELAEIENDIRKLRRQILDDRNKLLLHCLPWQYPKNPKSAPLMSEC